MNIKKLRCAMIMNDDTTQKLAESLDISIKTLRDKIHGRSEFKHSEIQKIIERYYLTEKQASDIFGWKYHEH